MRWRRGKLPVFSVGVVRLEPEDTVVVQFRQRSTLEELDAISGALAREFPNNKVIVLDDGAKLEVVKPWPG